MPLFQVPTLVSQCSNVLACRIDTIRGWEFLPAFVALMILRSHACRPSAAALERIAKHHPTVPEALGDTWDKLWTSLIARKLGVESRRHPYKEAGVCSVQAWYYFLCERKAERKAQLEARFKEARAKAHANPAKRKKPRKLELKPREVRERERKAKQRALAAKILAKQGISLPSAAPVDTRELGSSRRNTSGHKPYTGPTHTRKVIMAGKPQVPSRAGGAAAGHHRNSGGSSSGTAPATAGRSQHTGKRRRPVGAGAGDGSVPSRHGTGRRPGAVPAGSAAPSTPFSVAVFGNDPPRRVKKRRAVSPGQQGSSGASRGHAAAPGSHTSSGKQALQRRGARPELVSAGEGNGDAATRRRSSGGGGSVSGAAPAPAATKSLWAHSKRKKLKRSSTSGGAPAKSPGPGSSGTVGVNGLGERNGSHKEPAASRSSHSDRAGDQSRPAVRAAAPAPSRARSASAGKRKDVLGRLLGL